MIGRAFRCALLAAVAGAGLVGAAASPAKLQSGAVERGRLAFQRQCAPCHGQSAGDDGSLTLPGTAALERKYKGERPAALEKRSDLSAEIVRLFVRNGSGAMPMFRKAELSDAMIDDIAGYLQVSSSRHGSEPAP